MYKLPDRCHTTLKKLFHLPFNFAIAPLNCMIRGRKMTKIAWLGQEKWQNLLIFMGSPSSDENLNKKMILPIIGDNCEASIEGLRSSTVSRIKGKKSLRT